MIKRRFYFLAFLSLFSCKQQQNKIEAATDQTTAKDVTEAKKPEKETSWLSPAYLTADLNGDGYTDTAFAVIYKNRKGISIMHGNTNERFLLGAGNEFGNGGDDFDWVEHWTLLKDKMTYEVTFTKESNIDGSRDVSLDNPAFYLGTEDQGGATVAWKEGKYIWIHQAH